MQGKKLTGSAGFAYHNIDESGSKAGSPLGMFNFDCGFTETNLIWLHPGWEVPCGLCDILATISRLSISSPHVVGRGAGESSFVCGWTTARTLNSDLPYFLSRSSNQPAASSHPCWVNSSSFICFCRNVSMRYGTVLVIVPITQPGLSSSLSLPYSVSSWCSSFASSPSSEFARSLRLSPIATSISSMLTSGFLDVNRAISSCVLSSCSCWTTASASSTRFLAPVVSLST